MAEPSPLAPEREALVALSAAVATRDEGALEEALHLAAALADPVAVEEVLLQSHLFVGFPIALEALVRWRAVSGAPAPAGLEEDAAVWARRGAEVCERIYAANYPKLRANVTGVHPDFDRWMVEGGYGRVLGRPGLDLVTRELCVVALLAVWDAPRQLHSHLRGARNAGASAAEVERAVELACRQLGPESAREVRALWRSVAARQTSEASDTAGGAGDR